MILFPDAVTAALKSGAFTQHLLIEMDLGEVVLRETTAPYEVTHEGHTWLPSALFLGVDPPESNLDTNPAEIKFRLSAVDQTALGPALRRAYQFRAFRVLAFLADQVTGQPLADFAWPIRHGRLVNHQVDEQDDKATLLLMGETAFAQLDAPNSWRTNPASHHRRTPGDPIMDDAAKAAETIYWGRGK